MFIIGIDPGISGAICFLEDGKIIGMNSMGFKKSKGLNFAVPSTILCKVYKLLKVLFWSLAFSIVK